MSRIPTPAFPRSVLRVLAVDEFMALASDGERRAWASARGVASPMSPQLLACVKRAHTDRAANKRLGLPDPIR